GRLQGVISDGDLRRQMERYGYTLFDRSAGECMTRNPVLVGRRELATRALDLMETRKITALLVVDETGIIEGVLHLHDLWKTEMIGGGPANNDEALAQRCRALKLILTDVDGVMTDGTVLLLPDGREAKSFHIRDGLAIVMARRAGLLTGLLSGRV